MGAVPVAAIATTLTAPTAAHRPSARSRPCGGPCTDVQPRGAACRVGAPMSAARPAQSPRSRRTHRRTRAQREVTAVRSAAHRRPASRRRVPGGCTD